MEALRRPGQQEPGLVGHGDRGLPRPARAAPARARPRRSRSTTTSEIEGIRAIDRYTIRFTLKEPRPRFIETLAGGDLYGAVAREVVEFYGDRGRGASGRHRAVQARAVAAQLAHRASSATPTSARCSTTPSRPPTTPKARRCSRASRAAACRWSTASRSRSSRRSSRAGSSFVNGEADVAYRVGYQFAPQAMPNGKVAPNLAKQGIRGYPIVEAASNYYLFNMDDPVVGGYSAGPGRAAPRDRPRHRLAQDHRLRLQRPRHGGAGADAAEHDRLRPEAEDRVQRLRPGARRARCSTCTASSTTTATAGASGPTARRSCCASRRSRRRATARSPRCSIKNMKALGIRIELDDRANGRRT